MIALLAGNMLTQPPRRARRAAWATGLTLAAAAAFVPLVWVIAVAAALTFVAVRPALWRNLAIVALVPPVLLLPWSAGFASTPSALLLEVGLQSPGLTTSDLSARSLLLLSPGGPGLPPLWVTAGIALAALAALLLGQRRPLMMAGWGLAAGRPADRDRRQPGHDQARQRRSRRLSLARGGAAPRRGRPAAGGRDRGRGPAAPAAGGQDGPEPQGQAGRHRRRRR